MAALDRDFQRFALAAFWSANDDGAAQSFAFAHHLEHQRLATLAGSGQVSAFVITNGGSGYTSQPSVTVSAPEIESGTTAQISLGFSAGVLDQAVVVNPGRGYLAPPVVTLTGGGATQPATIDASLLTREAIASIDLAAKPYTPQWQRAHEQIHRELAFASGQGVPLLSGFDFRSASDVAIWQSYHLAVHEALWLAL